MTIPSFTTNIITINSFVEQTDERSSCHSPSLISPWMLRRHELFRQIQIKPSSCSGCIAIIPFSTLIKMDFYLENVKQLHFGFSTVVPMLGFALWGRDSMSRRTLSCWKNSRRPTDVCICEMGIIPATSIKNNTYIMFSTCLAVS